jgi:hypothetical protein
MVWVFYINRVVIFICGLRTVESIDFCLINCLLFIIQYEDKCNFTSVDATASSKSHKLFSSRVPVQTGQLITPCGRFFCLVRILFLNHSSAISSRDVTVLRFQMWLQSCKHLSKHMRATDVRVIITEPLRLGNLLPSDCLSRYGSI